MATPISRFGNTIGFDEPYLYASSAASGLVPGEVQIAIGGHPYVCETSFEFGRRDSTRSDSIEPVADKLDITNIPGESAVDIQGLWRREMQDFSMGAGQQFFDRHGSQDNRCLSTKGIYPWQQWQASLMNDTVAVHSSGTELQVLVVGSRVYINDNGTIRWSTGNLSSWTAVTGPATVSTTNAALATDGANVYIACGSNGVYLTDTSKSTAAQWINSATVDYIWYAGGQLMAAHLNLVYNITTPTSTAGPTALPSALLTHPNASFVWSSCAAGNSWVYLGGYTSNTSANFSLVFKTQMNTAGTALTVPIVAATLPGGELVYSLFAYTNFILVGTSLGARFCETLGINDPGGNAGDLKLGPIIPDLVQQVKNPVQCFTGQGRFAWFGWTNYDAVSTGLGRMDLSTFIDQQAPAYTSDLMVTGSGAITSMDWYSSSSVATITGVPLGTPIFVVNGSGVYVAKSTYVSQGVIDTGYITWGLPDNKVARLFDFDATGTAGSVGASITVDGGSATTVNAQTVSNALSEVTLPSLRGQKFDIQVLLNSGSTNTVTPILNRFMVKAFPAVVSGTIYTVIINLWTTDQTDLTDLHTDPYLEFLYLDGLRQAATPVQYQEGSGLNVTVIIKSITRHIYSERNSAEGGFNMRFEVKMQSLEN